MTWFQLIRGLYGYHLIGNVGLRLSRNPTLLWSECTSILYKYGNEVQWMERKIWQYQNIQIVCKNHLGQKNYIHVNTFLANLFNTASIQAGWKLVACICPNLHWTYATDIYILIRVCMFLMTKRTMEMTKQFWEPFLKLFLEVAEAYSSPNYTDTS